MPRLRLFGGIQVTSSPPTRMLPESGYSKPAMAIRIVVLPEPEGPSSARNSPDWTSSDTSSTAVTASKRLTIALDVDADGATCTSQPAAA